MSPKTEAAPNVESVDDAGWETVVEPFPETYTFETPGDTLVGTYKGNKEVETDDLNDPGKTRMQTVYTITDENGKDWGIWESYNVAEGMKNATPGDMVRFRFDGKVPIDGGKRNVKQFTIAVKRT